MPVKDVVVTFRRYIWRRFKRPGPPPGITLEFAGELFSQGMDYVERGQPERALEIAKELEGYRYTGAYEIEAMALFELGEAEEAIAALRRGLEKMPVWRNGHRLGIYLSDDGRYDEALEAFEASLVMYEAQPKMTAYNQAIVHNRSGNQNRAIELLESIVSDTSGVEEPKAVELASNFLAKLQDSSTPPPRRRSSRIRRRR